MRKLRTSSLLIFMSLFGVALYANDSIDTNPPRRLQVGANYTRARISPEGHPHFSGNLGGAQALFDYQALNQLYGGFKFAWREGATHGSSGSRTLLDFDVQSRLGYTFGNKDQHWVLSAFSGFGFRYLREHVSSIRFIYNEFYIPVGFLSAYQFNSLFALGLDATWMPQVYPSVFINPLGGTRWVITNKLANFLIEMPCIFTVCSKHHLALIFKPFFEYWQDGHTTAKTSLGLSFDLPGNTYLFGGADLNLCYSF